VLPLRALRKVCPIRRVRAPVYLGNGSGPANEKRLTTPHAALVFITHYRCGPATVKRILGYLADVSHLLPLVDTLSQRSLRR